MNINIKFVPWEILIQKPVNDIVAEFLRIAVSSSREKIHVDQCRNQIKEEIKISFCLALISLLIIPHPTHICQMVLYSTYNVNLTMRSYILSMILYIWDIQYTSRPLELVCTYSVSSWDSSSIKDRKNNNTMAPKMPNNILIIWK